ncbi:MAG: hypothetical protein EHM36_15040 [Deltaproteobacteria bacterium]|nr:MAG: hypothetical protein EHM36_15040 [Deltaproteobacteria bacterium]
MSVIMIETHRAIVRRVRKRAFIACGILTLLLAVSVLFPLACKVENDLITESYGVVRKALASIEGRYIVLELLRTKPLSVGQALEVADVVMDETKRNRVPVYLVLGLMETESSFMNDAVSRVGAAGLMQVMPAVWTQYLNSEALKKDPTSRHNAALNVRVAIRYLGDLAKKHGDWRKVLRVYGGYVKKNPDLYVNAVMAKAGQYRVQLGGYDGYRLPEPEAPKVRQ